MLEESISSCCFIVFDLYCLGMKKEVFGIENTEIYIELLLNLY